MTASIHLFKLASEHTRWLSARQSAIASNLAQVNTPAYRAVDVAPFESTLSRTALTMSASNPAHFDVGRDVARAVAYEPEAAGDATHSGNTVVLEQELMKAGEVHRDFALTSSIIKAHHRMLMAAAKG